MPTFDRLVREGVLFDNAFVSSPSCTPSRHAVASGQYHWRAGVGADLGSSMASEVPVYPDLLAAAGYETGFCRKGTAPSKHTHRGNDPFGPRFKNFTEFHAQRKPDQPFCFWYGAGEPHRPYRWQESARRGMDLDAIRVPACLPDNETVRTDLGDYYVKVERFDTDAARMIALLEKSGELEDTIVVMSGDNGMPFPRCKATLYDMGTRVPLVVRWGSRVKGGRKIADFVSLTDLAPTFLEAAGLPVPEVMSGQSLMAHLDSGKITNVQLFEAENRRMPWMMLHELSHAYHDQVPGFGEKTILAAYRKAKASGKYDAVKRFNGKTVRIDKAYAMANHKEYFAELTEALFGRNDFEPFTREELEEFDPEGLRVVAAAWGVEL